MCQSCLLKHCNHLVFCCALPAHPESQGVLERFHQTLKGMLKKYCFDTGNEWDEGIPLVLFAIRETTQESLKFSPAELVFGHAVRGPLKVLKEQMLGLGTSLSPKVNVLDYVSRFRDRIHEACLHAKVFLSEAQHDMKQYFDKDAVSRSFAIGEKVLVLLPIPGSSLSARFAGPYEVVEKLSNTDYVIKTHDRKRQRRVCHINMIKAYHAPKGTLSIEPLSAAEPVVSVAVCAESSACSAGDIGKDIDHVKSIADSFDPFCFSRLTNSEMIIDFSSRVCHLSERDLVSLVQSFPKLFGDVPSQTSVLFHDIEVSGTVPIKQHPYRLNSTKRALMKQEVEYLLKEGLAEPSVSSPCILVPKADGGVRFCTDYRKVNSVTVSDCFPLPRMEDCIDNVGSAKFVSKLDMLKGYWQVPLTARASEISAFVTPDGFFTSHSARAEEIFGHGRVLQKFFVRIFLPWPNL